MVYGELVDPTPAHLNFSLKPAVHSCSFICPSFFEAANRARRSLPGECLIGVSSQELLCHYFYSLICKCFETRMNLCPWHRKTHVLARHVGWPGMTIQKNLQPKQDLLSVDSRCRSSLFLQKLLLTQQYCPCPALVEYWVPMSCSGWILGAHLSP